MHISRKLLRIWLTLSSFIGLVAGWIFLSHTIDPETVTRVGSTSVEMPDIQPIPTLDTQGSSLSNGQMFSVNPNPPQPSFSPSFRTSGS
jgi:hypothetical protein